MNRPATGVETLSVALSHVNEKHSTENSNVDPVLVAAFEGVLAYLGRNNDQTDSEKANFADTAVRAAKAFASLTSTRTEIIAELREILKTGFPREHDANYVAGLITQGPVQVFSYCPHHLLPVEYQVYLSYVPGKSGMVLGLSKLARIAKLLGQRPILQEQLASDIADVLFAVPPPELPGDDSPPLWTLTPEERERTYAENTSDVEAFRTWVARFPGIESRGSAVLLTGKHSCMTCRGVHSDALTSVSELRGIFWGEGFEQKFYQAISAINSSTLR